MVVIYYVLWRHNLTIWFTQEYLLKCKLCSSEKSVQDLPIFCLPAVKPTNTKYGFSSFIQQRKNYVVSNVHQTYVSFDECFSTAPWSLFITLPLAQMTIVLPMHSFHIYFVNFIIPVIIHSNKQTRLDVLCYNAAALARSDDPQKL